MSLRSNLIANYLGQSWTALIGLAFIPLYIHHLGLEAYGLIGLFAVLQAWLSLLDLGMTPALNREVARHGAGSGSNEYINDLVHTFEIICVALALVIAISLAISSDWIAGTWLNTDTLSNDAVARSLSIMGLVAALRFIEGLYRGALLGMQRHVWLNTVSALFATIRAAGALAVLVWIENSIEAFFWWQAIVSILTLAAFYLSVHVNLPKAARSAAFSTQAIVHTWKFAGGVFITTFLTLMITQVDKVLLSRLLNLEAFGIYAFAATVAGVLFQLIGPIAQSYYPKFSEITALGDQKRLSDAYHQGAQLMSIMLVPASLILIAFSEPLLRIWTGNAMLSEQAAAIVSVLSIGTLLNGWMHIPYMLQLAHGWSALAAWTNLVAAILLVPAILWITPRYGAIGAAWVWVCVNTGYILFAIHLMHSRVLRNEGARWYYRDLAMPALGATATVSISYLMLPISSNNIVTVLWIVATGGIAYIAAILGASHFRHRFFEITRQMRPN